MQKIRRRKFGEILVAEGLVTREILQDALQRQHGTGLTLGEILLNDGVITEGDIVRCLSSQYQLPFIRTVSYDFETTLLNTFGVEFLYKHKVVPLDKIGNCTIIAVAEIPDENIERQLIDTLGTEVYYYVSPIRDVITTLRSHFKLGPEKMMALDEMKRSERAQRQMAKPGNQAVKAPPQQQQRQARQAGQQAKQNKLLQSLDASWEVIFDEAEENLRTEETQ